MQTRMDLFHPAFSRFDSYYTVEIEPALLRLEPERRRTALHCRLIIGATALAIAVSIFVSIRVFESFGGALVWSFVFFLACIFALNWRMEDNFTAINDSLLGGISTFLALQHTGDAYRPRGMATFKKYGVVPDYNEMECGDIVEGEWENTKFAVSEAFLSKRSGSKNRSGRTVFKGQLFRIELPFRFAEPVVFVRRKGFFARWRAPFSKAVRASSRIDGFRKNFHIWSESPTAVDQLADVDLASKLDRLIERYKKHRLRVAIVGNRVYIAIQNGDRLSAGSLFKSLTGKNRIKRAAREYSDILATIELFAA